jgi:hypothetical protein
MIWQIWQRHIAATTIRIKEKRIRKFVDRKFVYEWSKLLVPKTRITN